MAALTNAQVTVYDNDGLVVDTVALKPVRSRQGVFTFSGKGEDTAIFPNLLPMTLTASVRPGRAADYINKVTRVKRRTIVKVKLPLQVPGEEGPINDNIDVELVVSSPVDATDDQMRTAIMAASQATVSTECLQDMFVNGAEPF